MRLADMLDRAGMEWVTAVSPWGCIGRNGKQAVIWMVNEPATRPAYKNEQFVSADGRCWAHVGNQWITDDRGILTRDVTSGAELLELLEEIARQVPTLAKPAEMERVSRMARRLKASLRGAGDAVAMQVVLAVLWLYALVESEQAGELHCVDLWRCMGGEK